MYLNKGRGPFYVEIDKNIVIVWDGDPKEPEAEPVLTVDRSLIPSLIASLRMVEE